MNDHVIADWVRWNYEGQTYRPRLVYEIGERAQLTVEEYERLVNSNSIDVDDPLREYWRDRFGLPEPDPDSVKEEPEPPPPAPIIMPPPTPPELEGEANDLPDRDLRRKPTEIELNAQVDFERIEEFYLETRDSLAEDWFDDVRPGQLILAEADIITAGGDLEAIASIDIPPSEDGEAILIVAAGLALAEGISQATAEARAQGVTLRAPQLDDVVRAVQTRARALSIVLANALNTQISEAAGALTGGGIVPETVGELVRKDLVRQGAGRITGQLGGLVAQSTGEGRIAAMREVPDDIEVTYFATELLDQATCGPCRGIDGTEYDTIDESLEDYPSGQYFGCSGGQRCRGFVAASYGG